MFTLNSMHCSNLNFMVHIRILLAFQDKLAYNVTLMRMFKSAHEYFTKRYE